MGRRSIPRAAALVAILWASAAFADGWDPLSKATNTGSIVNTRHNLTQSFLAGWESWMNATRNQYGEVCVYCHTPHGANSTINAPLWNRTNLGNTYTLYNIPLTSQQTPTQPGVNSLTCLSCHDGTLAIDSVINMPGSGLYSAAQETAQNNSFLNSWTGAGPGTMGGNHAPLFASPGEMGFWPVYEDCQDCHSQGNPWDIPNFRDFYIGTDLKDDHPVGVQLPDTAVYDFKAPNGMDGSLKFFDGNANGRAESTEIRFYDTGGGFEVECASCHDPHGAPSAGPGSVFIPSFLRVSNSGSALCLTCHDK